MGIVEQASGGTLFLDEVDSLSRQHRCDGARDLCDRVQYRDWGDVFGDRVIATAILDRILHHAITINIRGNSYRLKDKLKAGLIRPAEDSE
jgi:hypothetical protein